MDEAKEGFFAYSKDMKAFCTDCGWRGQADKIDQVQDTKSPMVWDICPQCRMAEHISMVCDEPDCWEIAVNGKSTPTGYRRVCGVHFI